MSALPTTLDSRTDLLQIFELAQQLRVDSVRSSTSAGSGHPTSSLSAADLMAVLLARHLHYDWSAPDNPMRRPPHLLQGACVTSPLRHVQGSRSHQ